MSWPCRRLLGEPTRRWSPWTCSSPRSAPVLGCGAPLAAGGGLGEAARCGPRPPGRWWWRRAGDRRLPGVLSHAGQGGFRAWGYPDLGSKGERWREGWCSCVPTHPRVALREGTQSHGHQHPPVAHSWEQRPAGVADGGPHPRFTRTPSPSGAGQAHDGDTVPPLRLHKTRAVAWDMQMHILLLPLGGNPPTRPALIQLQLIGSCLRGFNFTGCRQNGFILPRVPMGTQGTAACRYGTGQGLTQKQHIWPQKEALWGQMVETPQISGSCSKLPGPVSAGVSLA